MPISAFTGPTSVLLSQQAAALPDAGAMVPAPDFFANLTAAFNNASSPGQTNFVTTAGATYTITNPQNLELMLTNGGAVTVTFDNAPNICRAIAGAYQGMTFSTFIAGTSGTTMAAPTVTNTGVTLSGTTTVTTGGFRKLSCQITQLSTTAVNPVTSGTTFTSITQIGSTNLYTLALGTNAITTTVGNLIYIGTTSGTLPAGWYPCYTAGTTSIVVALPPNGTAWTCTAASMVQPAAPTTPVYAPLITATGMYGMSAGVMVA